MSSLLDNHLDIFIPASFMMSEAFKYILYADDTTLFNTIQISVGALLDINNQLAKISDRLAVN